MFKLQHALWLHCILVCWDYWCCRSWYLLIESLHRQWISSCHPVILQNVENKKVFLNSKTSLSAEPLIFRERENIFVYAKCIKKRIGTFTDLGKNTLTAAKICCIFNLNILNLCSYVRIYLKSWYCRLYLKILCSLQHSVSHFVPVTWIIYQVRWKWPWNEPQVNLEMLMSRMKHFGTDMLVLSTFFKHTRPHSWWSFTGI